MDQRKRAVYDGGHGCPLRGTSGNSQHLRGHGSISAEHGIGIAKRDWLPRVKDKVALEVMRTLKQTLDPNGILNPGKVL